MKYWSDPSHTVLQYKTAAVCTLSCNWHLVGVLQGMSPSKLGDVTHSPSLPSSQLGWGTAFLSQLPGSKWDTISLNLTTRSLGCTEASHAGLLQAQGTFPGHSLCTGHQKHAGQHAEVYNPLLGWDQNVNQKGSDTKCLEKKQKTTKRDFQRTGTERQVIPGLAAWKTRPGSHQHSRLRLSCLSSSWLLGTPSHLHTWAARGKVIQTLPSQKCLSAPLLLLTTCSEGPHCGVLQSTQWRNIMLST